MNFGKKKGQVAIFIIVALVIVVGVILYFVLGDKLIKTEIPLELSPVFSHYENCIEEEVLAGLELAGSQGGYVYVPDYIPGSAHAPFSSHLNFLGFPVPYWYYVSANGVVKEQVLSRGEIESQMERFVEDGLVNCDFESFYQQGYKIEIEEPNVKVDIKETKVEVEVDAELNVAKGEDEARKVSHETLVYSNFGKFYSLARKIYDTEKSDAMFEKFASDVVRLYAPVDGVEIGCAPKIWGTQKVMSDIKNGLEQNFMTLKFKGDYYELKDEERKYFVLDEDVDEAVNLMYSSSWPTKIEIIGDGVDEAIMIAEPVGLEEGMGAMGFCYVPYHFVYDVSFPVLVQIYDKEELFQFAVVGVIDKNMPRERLYGESIVEEEEFDLCKFENQRVYVSLFDVNLNPVDGNLSFECFNQRCRLGETENGVYNGYAPGCVNGYLNVRAEGYADKRELFSSNSEAFADIILDREHEVEVEVDGLGDGTAIASFVKDGGGAQTVALPEVNKVKLSEGNYSVSVYVYGDSSIRIPETTKTHCQEVPRSGLLGVFGMTKEKCFDFTVPGTTIEYALVGGGSSETYLLESELEKGKVVLNVDKFNSPSSLDDLQKNFELLDVKGVGIEFYG